MTEYYSLLIKDEETNEWFVEFGDYDKETVNYERDANMPRYRQSDLKVIKTNDENLDINIAVAKLNARKG